MALVSGLLHAVSHAYHLRFDRPASLQKWDLPSGPLAHHLSILGSKGCIDSSTLPIQLGSGTASSTCFCFETISINAPIRWVPCEYQKNHHCSRPCSSGALDIISMISMAISQVLENRQAASFAGEYFTTSGKPPR